MDDARRSRRRLPEPEVTGADEGAWESPFRRDLERIRFSPYYSRLSAVTQVIGQTGAGPLVHNRLTHSLKVTAVARSIAVAVRATLADEAPARPAEYVCDPVVAQAAASSHDLGHPPFGHLGERVLDRIARERLGLEDGFEGNAQTYRILVALDVCHGSPRGLNLTAATRSAVAKYPWTSAVSEVELPEGGLPPGIRRIGGELVVRKYSAYFLDAADLHAARADAHGLLPLQQSLDGSIMDLADDIAYSIHDVDDFHRAGVLGQSAVAVEFRGWAEDRRILAAAPVQELTSRRPRPGSALELLRRKLQTDDPWIADEDAFALAVAEIAEELVDGLLAEPFDGSITAERSLSTFTSQWIDRFRRSVVLTPGDNPRAGLVSLDRVAWHEVEVLKFVHRHFVLGRTDITMYQRGLSRVLQRVVKGLVAWLDDDLDRDRVPPRLHELVELAQDSYAELVRDRPGGVPLIHASEVRRLGQGRGVLDYVASLSDGQAMTVSEAIDGRPDRLWDIGQGL